MNIGWAIESTRLEKNISQQRLAFKIGVQQNVISRWERDIVRPSNENEEKIARGLGTTVKKLYLRAFL